MMRRWKERKEKRAEKSIKSLNVNLIFAFLFGLRPNFFSISDLGMNKMNANK